MMKIKLQALAALARRNALKLSASTSVLAISNGAHAALPTEVTTSIETAGGDLMTAGTTILAVMVGFWGLKKVGTKMGWW
ncbi:MAG: major capsid protein [Hydrogenophaga sp.]|uniref:major capsid protein n=2 Tax=Hydrogenophaga sp. TaxID=1904254 RepID=UPI002721F4A8|nr:major capsid protein [Hydrogenophaga sp.]MDO9482961.1 major capsid protein [Hydrogenophaga sp.]MDP3924264.1 major capsid protein [Hydrogenophaga sp.]